MKTFGNILWLLCGGLMAAFSWFIIGIIFYITIIGIPIANQCFKFGELTLTPFGKEVRLNFDKHPILNTIWLIFIGIWGFLGQAAFGLLLIITIIGIPFGLQYFKLAKLTLIPFGAKIVNAK
jgi:uncharacterized membrane protein YccF (DUF307 family)